MAKSKSRKDERALVSLTARYRSPTTFEYVEEECYDVSVGGMFIRSTTPAPAGTLIKLECDGAVAPGKIRGVARVVWLRRGNGEGGPGGMGVKFVKLEPGSRDLIRRIVQQAGQERPPEVSASLPPQPRPTDPPRRSDPTLRGMPPAPAGEVKAAAEQALESAPRAASIDAPASEREPAAETVAASEATPPPEPARSPDTAASAPQAAAQPQAAPGAVAPPTAADEPVARAQPVEAVIAETFSERGYVEAEPGTAVLVRAPSATEIRPEILEGDTTPPEAPERSKAWKTWGLAIAFALGFLAIVSSDWFEDAEGGTSSEPLQVDTSGAPDTLPVDPPHPAGTPPAERRPVVPAAPAATPAVTLPPPSAAKPEAFVPAPLALPPAAPSPEPVAPANVPRAAVSPAKPAGMQTRALASKPPGRATTDAKNEPATSPSRAPTAPVPPASMPVATAPQPSAAAPSAQPKPVAAKPKGSPMEVATTCLARGDNTCVIQALDGQAKNPREFELLIETLRTVGRTPDAQKHMATYVQRFPNERRTASYRRLLEAQATTRQNPVPAPAKPIVAAQPPRPAPAAAP